MTQISKYKEMREIALADLVIDTAQVRTRGTSKEVEELSDSIAKVGVIEPIVVCPAEEPGKFSIITGQRRFLACQELEFDTIPAVVLDKRLTEIEAKVLSVTENLVRTDLSSRDLIDVCMYLYNRYGSLQAVSEETGLPYNRVRQYVKYDRLIPELRELVDKHEVDVSTALRAQDAATTDGDADTDDAVMFAKEMSPMSGAQQKKIVEERAKQPTRSADDVIEDAKAAAKITQIVVTLSSDVHTALGMYAESENESQDTAAGMLIHDGLYLNDFIETQRGS